jgi:hypothetical protein
MSDTGDGGSSGRRIKVVRLLDEYDLDGVGDRMERLWTETGDERMSLRELADLFNRELVRAALARAGAQLLDGEVANIYRLLTDEETAAGDRTRAQRRLAQYGVDVDKLRRDFVTYQAIRTYLTEHRDASYSADTRDRTGAERQNIQRLRGRLLTVTESKVEQLTSRGDIELGEHRTFVDIRILCEDCGEQFSIDDLLDRGGCACRDEPENP